MAFQHLSTRERETKDGSSINVQNIKVEVCVFLFDVMLANGDPLVKCPFRERRKHMHKLFPNLRPGYFQYANEITVGAQEAEPDLLSTSQSLDLFLDASFEASCEAVFTGLTACMHDECSRWGLDRTLAHVLDVLPLGPEVIFITNDKVDLGTVRSYLVAQPSNIRDADESHTSGYGNREGVFINKSSFGNGIVIMDSESASGDVKFDKSSMVLESQTIFSSAQANSHVEGEVVV